MVLWSSTRSSSWAEVPTSSQQQHQWSGPFIPLQQSFSSQSLPSSNTILLESLCIMLYMPPPSSTGGVLWSGKMSLTDSSFILLLSSLNMLNNFARYSFPTAPSLWPASLRRHHLPPPHPWYRQDCYRSMTSFDLSDMFLSYHYMSHCFYHMMTCPTVSIISWHVSLSIISLHVTLSLSFIF